MLQKYINLPLVVTYTILVIVTLIGLLLIQSLNISYPLHVSVNNASELAVMGEGRVDATPNMAQVTAGISVSDVDTASHAQKQINDINNKIIEGLTKIGIAKKDIKTSNYSINPSYTYNNGKNTLNGYNANAQVTITVRNTGLLSQVMQSVTDAGANTVNSGGFTVEDPAKYREQARQQAIQNAREQAQKIASELGIHLGKVVNMVENTGSPVPVVYNQPFDALSKGAGAPAAPAPVIEPGSQTVTSTVTLYFDTK